MKEIIYSNLTQNLDGDRFVYLRSTDVEQMHWERLLWCVPDEWFYRWSRGEKVILIDKTSNTSGKIKRIFFPVFMYILHKVLDCKVPEVPYKCFKEHLIKAEEALIIDNLLLRRIQYWKGKIKEVNFEVRVIHVDKQENPLDKPKGGIE